MSLLLTASCSLVVDTEQLTAGDEGLDCASTQKICPVSLEEPEGPRACVSLTLPENGCGLSSCRACEVPGAVPRCTSQGTCGVAICEDGFSDCDDEEGNGCEVDLLYDEENCGRCGVPCALGNAVSSCVLGVCEFVVCRDGYLDCDGRPENGCEVDSSTDGAHCGKCDNLCESTCESGTCQ